MMATMLSSLRFKRRDTLPAHLIEHRVLFDKSTDVVTLNNIGISQLSQGADHYPYAAAYFARAVLVAMDFDRVGMPPSKKRRFRPKKFVQKRILGKQVESAQPASPTARSSTSTGTTPTPTATTATTSSSNTRPGFSLATSLKHQELHIFKDMVPIENGCDDDHLVKAVVVYNVAITCAMEGKFENADHWFNRCHVLVSDQPNDAIDTGIKLMHNCGYVNFQLGRYDLALQYWYCSFANAVLRNQQGSFKSIFDGFMVLSKVHQDEGRDAEALQVLTKVQLYAIKAFHTEQPEHAACLVKLFQQMAELSDKLGDLPNAVEHYKKLLEIQLEVLEQDHNDTLNTMSKIAHLLKAQQKYLEALKFFEKLLHADIRVYREKNPMQVAETLDEVAWLRLQLQDYEKSMDAYQEALRIRREVYGDEHFEVTVDLEQVGRVLLQCEAYDAAMDATWEALTVRIKLLGKDHERVADLWHSLGDIYMEMGQSEETIKCEKEALRIKKVIHGDVHSNVARALHRLGFAHMKRGEQPLGLAAYQEELAVERQLKGSNDLDIASLLQLVAAFHLNIGQTREFMECMVEALRICHHHGQTADSLRTIIFDMYHTAKLHPECAAVA